MVCLLQEASLGHTQWEAQHQKVPGQIQDSFQVPIFSPQVLSSLPYIPPCPPKALIASPLGLVPNTTALSCPHCSLHKSLISLCPLLLRLPMAAPSIWLSIPRVALNKSVRMD